MNSVALVGRLTRDPEVRYSTSGNQMAIAKFTIAVDRDRASKDSEQSADFIGITCFGKTAELVEKYMGKGRLVGVTGRIQTGSYTNKDGQRVYTTDVVIENVEFAESKNAQDSGSFDGGNFAPSAPIDGGFMNIPDGVDEELPFN